MAGPSPAMTRWETPLATTVDLENLKAVTCRLIDELAFQFGSSEFPLPENDFYWLLSFKAKMNMTEQPLADGAGRLRDDWELTHWLADHPEQVSAYSLTEVAELLSYLGHASADLPFRPREEESR
jgi:hypothetical protein